MDKVKQAYELARERYAKLGVDTDKAIEEFSKQEISLHCWQGDDVAGFEPNQAPSQNVVTGNYPGKATTPGELRGDIEKVFSFSPSAHRVNLHSVYAEDICAGRDAYTVENFRHWIDWAKKHGWGLDYNGSFFAHDMMKHDMSLASPDEQVRAFWIRHGVTSRRIANEIGRALGKKCVHNIWIPDGLKDTPADRRRYRALLKDSLDQIFAEKLDSKYSVDVLEGKLFGIGTESYVVGSYDFYLGYAIKNGVGICLDTGHFHPTENVADKLSAVSFFCKDILLHVSRGVRWDSDHVVVFNDELQQVMQEVRRNGKSANIYVGLDYFDASINRVAAWTVGLRAASRAMLFACLEPSAIIDEAEGKWDFTTRLAMKEEFKALPYNAVWDYVCSKAGVPVGEEWLAELAKYSDTVISKRN